MGSVDDIVTSRYLSDSHGNCITLFLLTNLPASGTPTNFSNGDQANHSENGPPGPTSALICELRC